MLQSLQPNGPKKHQPSETAAHAHLTHKTNNRRALETKQSEARKLETLGRITGHFAHDF